jgi:hypothetical protein
LWWPGVRSTLGGVIGSPKGAPRTGLRRVSWVRIVVDGTGAHCQAFGVGHRRPSVRPVSLDTAVALAAAGVPTVVRSAHEAPVQAVGAR